MISFRKHLRLLLTASAISIACSLPSVASMQTPNDSSSSPNSVQQRLTNAANLQYTKDPKKIEMAAEIYLGIAEDYLTEDDLRMKAANALIEMGDPYKASAVLAYLAIAKDGKSFQRQKAAHAIKNLGFKTMAAQAYLAIAKDGILGTVDVAHAIKNLGFKIMAAEAYRSVIENRSKNGMLSSHLMEAAKALTELKGEENIKIAAQAYIAIAEDNKVDVNHRIEATSALTKLDDSYTQEAANVFLSIARNEKVDVKHRIEATSALTKLDDSYTQEAANVLLSIARNEKVDPKDRLRAADNLETLGQPYQRQASQGYLSIFKDEKMHVQYRIDAAKALTKLDDSYTQEATNFLLSITSDDKVHPKDRLRAAKALIKLDDQYKEIAAKVCLSIAEDANQDDPNNRMAAADDLMNLGEPYQQAAANAYLSIARDEKVDPRYHVQAANELLWVENQRDVAIGMLNGFMSDANKALSTATEIMDLVNHRRFALGHDHALVYQALTLSRLKHDKHPIAIYHSLLDKIKSPVTIEFPQEIVGKKKVTFTTQAFAPKVAPQSIPHADHGMVKKFFDDFSEELKNPKAMDQFEVANECILDDTTGQLQFATTDVAFSTFKNLVNRIFFRTSLKGNTIPAEAFKDPLVVKLHCLVHYLSTLDGTPKPDGLSDRSARLINFFAQTSSCMSGKKSGVDQMYQDLPAAYKIAIGSTDETEIYALERAARLNIIKEGLMKSILPSNNITEPAHQENYLDALLGQRIGLHYEGEKIPFDVHGEFIHQKLRDLSLQDALTAFFGFYTPQGMVERTKAYFNKKLQQEDQEAQYETTTFLFNTFCSADKEEKYKTFFSWKEDETLGIEKITAIIHPSITVKILSQLGFLTEVKDDMDRDGDSKETSSKKRKRKEGDGSHEHEPAQKKARLELNRQDEEK